RLRPQPKAATGQPIPIHTCKSERARGWSGKASRGCTRCWEGFVILPKKNSRRERTRYPGGKVRHKVGAAVDSLGKFTKIVGPAADPSLADVTSAPPSTGTWHPSLSRSQATDPVAGRRSY